MDNDDFNSKVYGIIQDKNEDDADLPVRYRFWNIPDPKMKINCRTTSHEI